MSPAKPAMSFDTIMSILTDAPFFAGAPREALEELVGDSTTVEMKKGSVFIREGEHEETCYMTLSGRYRIAVTDSDTGKMREVQVVGPGSLVGEMSILTGNPRFAQVSCVEKGLALMIHRDELFRFLDAVPEIRQRVDEDFRKRTLFSAFRRQEIFSTVDDWSIEKLARTMTIMVFQKGAVVFDEGDDPDSFYLIREGFVKLSRTMAADEGVYFDSRFDKGLGPRPKKEASEFTLSYLGAGSYFGERALFSVRRRQMTARAVTHLEVLQIGRDEFNELMERHPQLEERMRKEAASRYDIPAEAAASDKKKKERQEMLSWVEDHDILAGDNILILDLDRCVRCLNCIDVCAKLHHGVTRLTHNGIRFKTVLIPTSCRHCREPTCMIGCPTGAIQRDREGEVFHTDACIGCGNCAARCPFGNISMVRLDKVVGKKTVRERFHTWLRALFTTASGDDEKQGAKRRAVKCDMCKGYERQGCQHNCPTGAILTVEPKAFFTGKANE